MKWHLCLVISTFVIYFQAFAAEEEPSIVNPPLVEVYHNEDNLASYRSRRSDNGFMLSINSENFLPKNYLSTLDNVAYQDVYGNSPIQIIGVEFAYKRNFSLGAFDFGLGYGAGSIKSDTSGSEREMTITRPFAGVTYLMDNIFEEPYAVPYVGLKAWQLSISEKNNATKESFSATTQIGFTYTVGALIQLNVVDQDASEGATHNYGLENTYLDVFMAKSTQTQSGSDADTETDFNFGAGIRLEF